MPAQINQKKSNNPKEDSTCEEFVDDASVVVKAKTENELMSKMVLEYEALSDYLTNHLMVVNKEKTQIMIMHPDKDKAPPTINIQGAQITHQPSIKILGIQLTDNLAMDAHIWSGKQNMVKTLNAKTALLRTLKPHLPTKDLANIGSALINSTISYGAPIWGLTTQQNLDKVQKCQTKAARLIMSTGWKKGVKKMHRQDMLDNIGWQNTQQIVNTAILNLTKNAIDGVSAVGINKVFKTTQPINPRQKAGNRISHHGKISSNAKTFQVVAPGLYNQLPKELRNPVLSRLKFKQDLKTHSNTQPLLTKH